MAVSRRFGQKQTVTINMATVMAKYGKVVGDITKAVLTLKASETFSDTQAAFVKNSDAHPDQISYAEDGDGDLIITAIIELDDFGTGPSKVNSGVTYFVGGGLVFSDEDSRTTFELDTYSPSDDQIIFTPHRVDNVAG